MITTAASRRSIAEPPKRVLFDTDVLLDVLLKRPLFVREAALPWDRVLSSAIEGFVAAHAVTTIAYFVGKAYGASQALSDVQALLDTFKVAAVGGAELADALHLGFAYFEDAVVHEAARAVGCDTIVTRNVRDFQFADLSVFTPADLLVALDPASP